MKLVILFPDAEDSSNSSLLRKDESDVYYETGSNSGKKNNTQFMFLLFII